MPKYSVKKPFTILVAVILVLVLGFVSLTGIQTDLLPAMNLPYLMVITTYPGASPEQVEADVTKPLENALSTLNGVKNVTSQSNENYSLLFLEYQDDTDMDSAMVKASTAVNQLGDALPDMASTPTLMEISPDMMATQYIAVDYDGMDIYELSDYVSENVLPSSSAWTALPACPRRAWWKSRCRSRSTRKRSTLSTTSCWSRSVTAWPMPKKSWMPTRKKSTMA